MIAPYNTYHAYSVITPYLAGLDVAHIGSVQHAGLELLAQEAESLIHFDLPADAAMLMKRPTLATSPQFHTVSAKADALPCADKSIDVLLYFNSTQNVGEESALFAEAARILKPQGVFVLLTENSVQKPNDKASEKKTSLDTVDKRVGLEGNLQTYFREQHWLRQKYLTHSVVWPEGENSLFVNVGKFSDGEIKLERNLQYEAGSYLVIAHSAKEPCLPLGRLLSSVNILHNDVSQDLVAQEQAGTVPLSASKYRQLLLAQNAELQTSRYQLTQAQKKVKALEIEHLHNQAKIQNLEKELEKLHQQLEYNRVDTACMLRLREQLKRYREASLESSEVVLNHSSRASVAESSMSKSGRLRRWFAS